MLVYKLTSVRLNSYKKRQKAKSRGPSDFCRICGCSFAIRLGNFSKTSYISTENLFVKPKREGVLRRKLADVLVDLGIAVQADEFRSSRVYSSCASKTKSAASNIEFIKKSLARPIDGVESPKRKLIATSDSKECHVRLTRLRRSKSYAGQVIRQRILNNASKTRQSSLKREGPFLLTVVPLQQEQQHSHLLAFVSL